MNFEVLYTDSFGRELKQLAKKYRSIKEDVEKVITTLEKDPVQGTPIGHNCYKIRLAITSKGKGKSAGARLIVHLHITDKVVYLLSIYDKSSKESIPDSELKALIKEI